MFDVDIMWKWFVDKMKTLYNEVMCDHAKAVVVKNNDTEKITVCSNCGKRIVRNKSFWKKGE